MKRKEEGKYKKELREAIGRAAKNDALLDNFLKDILTPAEYREIAKRVQILKLLRQRMTHRDIADMLGVGIGTVVRGLRVLI